LVTSRLMLWGHGPDNRERGVLTASDWPSLTTSSNPHHKTFHVAKNQKLLEEKL